MDFGKILTNGDWGVKFEDNKVYSVGPGKTNLMGELMGAAEKQTDDETTYKMYFRGNKAECTDGFETEVRFTCADVEKPELVFSMGMGPCGAYYKFKINCCSQSEPEPEPEPEPDPEPEPEPEPEPKVEVTKCNKNDGTVAIHAHFNHAEKFYTEFDGENNAVFDMSDGLTSSFLPASGDKPAYLVLTKTLGSADCEKITVDGVKVSSNFCL